MAKGPSQGFPSAVKRRIGGIHAKPPAKRKPKLSRHPDAIRARRYRAERKGIAEALEAARIEKLERRRERDRQRRQEKRGGAGGGVIQRPERELALEWLERIREHAAEFSPTSLDLVDGGSAAGTPWMICGRFDLLEGVDYQTLGAIFQSIADDLILEAQIHPERLSQIRIIYSDPNSRKGEGDSIVSKISGWQFALGDIIGEILGGGPGDEGALAVRYDETSIGTFYVYFAATITRFATVGPWSGAPPSGGSGGGSRQAKTLTVKLR